MRKTIEQQLKLGGIQIKDIQLDLDSRDEIPKVLFGLQLIHGDKELLAQVIEKLRELTPKDVSRDKGRPGMDDWQVLVLGVIRLSCNWDYDKLKEIADNHRNVRLMLGLSPLVDLDEFFALQTIKDNLVLFTPELLKGISELVVKKGHQLIGLNADDPIAARCDSFVLESNIHFPTDISLLFDAMRKVIQLLSEVCIILGAPDWRQSKHNVKKVKKLFRKIQNLKHSTSQKADKKLQREGEIKEAYQNYIDLADVYLGKAKETRETLYGNDKIIIDPLLDRVEYFEKHAIRQIEQIKRRIINSETIPHCEKIFSVFEEHVEWISKGKAGVSQELGHRVAIVEDQLGFIINHEVMIKKTDAKVAVSIIEETKKAFPNLTACSFDKDFYSPANKKALVEILDTLTMPKKGKLSKEQAQEEYSEEFLKNKRRHSAVESAINALENHGLDRCLDKGLPGFERYTALAVLARNIEILGTMEQNKKRMTRNRREQYNETYRANFSNAA